MHAIVVTSNSARDLTQLLQCTPLRAAFDDIVVVDNASTDDSRDVARRAGVEVIARSTRRGFGAAVNLGATATTGPYFAVLNPDIRCLTKNDFAKLTDAFADPSVAIVGPALELPSGDLQDSARRVPTPAELLLRRRVMPTLGAITKSGSVPWVVGACMVVRREAFESVGGFDEGYALYFEDVDLCVRLRRRGWKVVFEPAVRLLHVHHAASRKSLMGRATRAHARSAARFYVRNPALVLGERT